MYSKIRNDKASVVWDSGVFYTRINCLWWVHSKGKLGKITCWLHTFHRWLYRFGEYHGMFLWFAKNANSEEFIGIYSRELLLCRGRRRAVIKHTVFLTRQAWWRRHNQVSNGAEMCSDIFNTPAHPPIPLFSRASQISFIFCSRTFPLSLPFLEILLKLRRSWKLTYLFFKIVKGTEQIGISVLQRKVKGSLEDHEEKSLLGRLTEKKKKRERQKRHFTL